MIRNDTAALTRSRRLLALAGLLLLGGLWAFMAWTVFDLRDQAWHNARQGAANLLVTSERALARDIELYDLSLRSVQERLNMPALEGLELGVRHLSLFDRLSRARGYGSIFVLDQSGRAFLDSGSIVPRRLDGSDRLYFTTQRDRADAGLFIGRPWRTRISGEEMVPLSRRLTYADKTFAGVIVGAIKLDYFREVFVRLNDDAAFTVTLQFIDGKAVVSSRGETGAEAGAATGYALTQQVAGWPLQVTVSIPAAAIDAVWMPRLRPIVPVILALTAAILIGLMLLHREFVGRILAESRALAARAELERLAATDPLTGLWNRRHFEAALARCADPAERAGLALLLVDADHFKHYNDRYGHPAGDRALERIAEILLERARAFDGAAFRIGGEEFALLVPISEDEAPAAAESVRARVAALRLTHAGHPAGILTLSVGLSHGAWAGDASPEEWLSRADEALYEAKRQGRYQVVRAGSGGRRGRGGLATAPAPATAET